MLNLGRLVNCGHSEMELVTTDPDIRNNDLNKVTDTTRKLQREILATVAKHCV
jgi:hypothetical protein